MDSQGGGTPRALVLGVMVAVVVVIGAVVLAFVPIGGDSGSDASGLTTTTFVPPPAPVPEPTDTFPTDPFPTDDPTTDEPTDEPTTDEPTEQPTTAGPGSVPVGYRAESAPGGLSVAIPETWPVKAGAVASNEQADDPDADCLLRFGGDAADARPLAAVVAGFEHSTPSIQRGYQRLKLTPVSYGSAQEAVDWEFLFTADSGPRHAYGRYWRTGGTDYVAYGSCAAGDWTQLGQPLTTLFDTADPQ